MVCPNKNDSHLTFSTCCFSDLTHGMKNEAADYQIENLESCYNSNKNLPLVTAEENYSGFIYRL